MLPCAVKLDLFSEAIVAIDGSKFKAVNNRDKNFTPHKLAQRMKQIDESIERYLQELDTADRTQSADAGQRGQQIQEKLAKLRQQMDYLREIEGQLKQQPDEQLSLTDPDARSMATSGRGTGMVGYNVQTPSIRSITSSLPMRLPTKATIADNSRTWLLNHEKPS